MHFKEAVILPGKKSESKLYYISSLYNFISNKDIFFKRKIGEIFVEIKMIQWRKY